MVCGCGSVVPKSPQAGTTKFRHADSSLNCHSVLVLHIARPFTSKTARVFPSNTLRNVPAFAQAFAQAYARANAGAKVKGGGVIPESGCEVGVTWV